MQNGSAWIGRRSCGTAGRLATGSDPESAAGGSRVVESGRLCTGRTGMRGRPYGLAKKRENAMEKQEILEKSRRENQKGDERERTIRMEGESFSLLFVFLMGLILLTWKRVHGLPHEDVLTMFWTACVANRVYRLARRRNTSDIVTLLISLAFLIWNLVKFFQMA